MANHNVPFQAILEPTALKVVVPIPIQLMPLYEYAMVFIPEPTAIHIEPFHANPLPCELNIPLPIPTQEVPL